MLPKVSSCRAKATCVDGTAPYEERCVRARGHAPPHACAHGFHWTDDAQESFRGPCGHCGQEVSLKPAGKSLEKPAGRTKEKERKRRRGGEGRSCEDVERRIVDRRSRNEREERSEHG